LLSVKNEGGSFRSKSSRNSKNRKNKKGLLDVEADDYKSSEDKSSSSEDDK